MQVVIIEDDEKWKNRVINTLGLNANNAFFFNNYCKELRTIILNKQKKVYLIDVQLNDSDFSGIDIAEQIREVDWQSILIFYSLYNLKEDVISLRLNALTYVSKSKRFETELLTAFTTAKKIINDNKYLEFNTENKKIKIFINDILYIIKDKNTKYCIIKTLDSSFRIRKSLKELQVLTELKLYKKHLIINEKNTKYIYKTKIVFINNDILEE